MTTPAGSGPDSLPYDELHEELGDHPEGREALSRLRDAVSSDRTDRAAVETHVGILQRIPLVGTRIANWFESPTTQGWLAGLSDIGL